MSESDPQIRRLLKKAFPIKKPDLRNREGICKTDPSLDPDRYEVYKNIIIPDDVIFAVEVVTGIALIGVAWGTGWSTFLIIFGLFIITIAVKNILMRLHHKLFFQNWRKRIPFGITGWDALVNRNIIDRDLCWSHTTIKIALRNASDMQYKTVLAALKIFCEKADKKFYTRDMDADDAPTFDKRDHWKIKEIPHESNKNTLAEGSANPEVIGQIFWLINGNLFMLNEKFPGMIENVFLTTSNKYDEVDIDAHYTGTG